MSQLRLYEYFDIGLRLKEHVIFKQCGQDASFEVIKTRDAIYSLRFTETGATAVF